MAGRRVWIFTRKLRTRTTYSLRWYDERNQMRTEAVGSDKRLATDARRRRELELNSGKFMDVTPIRLSDFVAEHLRLAEGRLAPGTLRAYRDTFRFFLEHSGDPMVSGISVRTVEEYLAERAKHVRPASVNKEHRCLKAAFNHAVKRRYLRENPCEQVPFVREAERKIRALTSEEVSRLLSACRDERMWLFVALTVTTGMRRGEVCALDWSDLDLEEGWVTVCNKDDHLTKLRRIRRLALDPTVMTVLRAWRKRSLGDRVFASQHGERVPNSMTKRFETLVKYAGIADCSVHDLRRTISSELAKQGVNEAVVQKLLGHASMQTTLDYYTHVLAGSIKAAQALLPYGSIVSKSYQGQFSRPASDVSVVVKHLASA